MPDPLDRLPGPDRTASEDVAAALDALRDHPAWDEERREATFRRLIADHPADVLLGAARARLGDLGGGEGEVVLRLLEAFAPPEVLAELAEALADQPQLAPERTWAALELLEGTGLIEARPELVERREELADFLGGEDPLTDLADQIEGEADGLWVALQGLDRVEPEVRAEILRGLAGLEAGPRLVEFFRVLAFAYDPQTRHAALAALDGVDRTATSVRAAWSQLAEAHPDPEVNALARTRLGGGAERVPSVTHPARPRVERSSVGAIDEAGRADVGFLAHHRGDWVAVVFTCDVLRGVVAAAGLVQPSREEAEEFFDSTFDGRGTERVLGRHDLALGLLAGNLLVSGPGAPPGLRYWIERTAGADFQPRPFRGVDPGPPPAATGPRGAADAARAVLAACPAWLDDSDLTYDLAEESLIGAGRASRVEADDGSIRFLFERRLRDRIERDRRMLLWMAALWLASGRVEIGHAALALATQLGDPQQVVPNHPFPAQLAARSLAAARANLRAGRDPRRGRKPPRALD